MVKIEVSTTLIKLYWPSKTISFKWLKTVHVMHEAQCYKISKKYDVTLRNLKVRRVRACFLSHFLSEEISMEHQYPG